MSAVVGQRSEYTPTEVETALRVLATFGNSERASEATGIKADTLRKWRTRDHAARYAEILHEIAPQLEQAAADQSLSLILRQDDATHAILDRLEDPELPSKEISELAGSVQKLTIAKGINTTKRLELLGRPTQIVQHLNPRETIQALARDLGVTIPSTAEEITDAKEIAA